MIDPLGTESVVRVLADQSKLAETIGGVLDSSPEMCIGTKPARV